eukprot:scaffold195063_cov50-Prasinocladus_malaysianus.AAC.1
MHGKSITHEKRTRIIKKKAASRIGITHGQLNWANTMARFENNPAETTNATGDGTNSKGSGADPDCEGWIDSPDMLRDKSDRRLAQSTLSADSLAVKSNCSVSAKAPLKLGCSAPCLVTCAFKSLYDTEPDMSTMDFELRTSATKTQAL